MCQSRTCIVSYIAKVGKALSSHLACYFEIKEYYAYEQADQYADADCKAFCYVIGIGAIISLQSVNRVGREKTPVRTIGPRMAYNAKTRQ